jgi:hypothetical protein
MAMRSISGDCVMRAGQVARAAALEPGGGISGPWRLPGGRHGWKHISYDKKQAEA